MRTLKKQTTEAANASPRQFHSVTEVARMLGMSPMTVYRAIAAGEFPAVRIQGRLIVPAKVIEAMAQAAIAGHTTVDAADWVADGTQRRSPDGAAFPAIAQSAGGDR